MPKSKSSLPKPGDIVTVHFLGTPKPDNSGREIESAPARVLQPSGDETSPDMLDLEIQFPPDQVTDLGVLQDGRAAIVHKTSSLITYQNNIPKHPGGEFPGFVCWSS